MMRLESGLTLTLATLRSRSIALFATGWVTKMRGRAIAATARRRRPRRPRPARRPGCGCVASSTPSTIGMPRSRASEARCEVEPPSSATTPPTCGSTWLSAGRPPASPGCRRARRATIRIRSSPPRRGPEPQPMPAGWPLRPGCLQPDLVRHDRRLDRERPRLQQLEARHRRAPIRSRPGRRGRLPPCASGGRASPPVRRRGRARATRSLGTACGMAPAPWPQVSRWSLRPASIVRRKPWRESTMRSGTTSPCAIAEPSPQVALMQHLAFGGLAQAAARGARVDQRLDQHRHRGIGGREVVVLHVAARIGGPQRRPAGAHRGEEIRLVVDAKEALELAGEIGALAVLDQCRGAHRARRGAARALCPPGGEQRIEDRAAQSAARRDRA